MAKIALPIDYTTDKYFPNRRAARGKLGQVGKLSASGRALYPDSERLKIYERMVRIEGGVKYAVRTYCQSVVSTIGSITHPDSDASAFLNHTLASIEDDLGRTWKDILFEMLFTSLWAGFSVSEPIYDVLDGKLRLIDITCYHPSTIIFRPDKNGRLTEGQDTYEHYKSGVYQRPGFVPAAQDNLIPMWKVIYHSNEAEYGNYLGHSLLAPAYKWLKLKDLILDMMVIYLNKAGQRSTWVRSSDSPTGLTKVDPSTGIEEALTTLDLIRSQVEEEDGSPEFLLLPQTNPDVKPEAGTLASSDNIGDLFLKTLDFIDQEAVRDMVPYFLISDRTPNNHQFERRMEVYYNQLDVKREKLIGPLRKKVMHLLLQWNFSRTSAMSIPNFTRVASDRPEDRVSTMQMVKGLTENGYLNPTNELDWQLVRQMVRLADRTMEKKDSEFIRKMLIEPREKNTPSTPDLVRGTQSKEGRPTGDVTPQVKDRVTEN